MRPAHQACASVCTQFSLCLRLIREIPNESTTSCRRQNTAPCHPPLQNIHVLVPQTHEYIALHGKRIFQM